MIVNQSNFKEVKKILDEENPMFNVIRFNI